MKKRLVVFYSLSGNTKEAAKKIAEQIKADIVELKPVKKVPESNFIKFMIGGMQATFGMCPKLQELDCDLGLYEDIILGTPIWAGKCAPAINSFLKSSNVVDKVSATFTCSGGGDNDKCMENLKKRLPNLRHSVALADRANKLAKDNEIKLGKFIGEI